ncbi:MAG: 3-hydroxyacyl-CoA dehydrogenase family protein [Desulfacinum sp.]|nr:3-hydroxyacyl-CoA dehydrogenase family protein [Desulfacinum sp.]
MGGKAISTVGILGAGLMGHGIAQIFASRGFRVRIHDVDRAMLEAVPRRIRDNFQVFVELGLARPEDVSDCLDRIALCGDVAGAVADADLVVEAVTESLAVKVRVFEEVERHVPEAAVLCSNTSAISISEIARCLRHPRRFLGTHFWNPPHVVPCVEVIKGEKTSEQVFEGVVELMRRLGKEPVRVLKDVPGFLGNRLQHAMWREAVALVADGIADAEDIDKVVKYGFGLRCAMLGPLETADLAGLDLTHAVHQYLFPHLNADTSPSPLLQNLISQGRLGVKTGQGFHRWTRQQAQELIQKRDSVLLRIMELIRPQRG